MTATGPVFASPFINTPLQPNPCSCEHAQRMIHQPLAQRERNGNAVEIFTRRWLAPRLLNGSPSPGPERCSCIPTETASIAAHFGAFGALYTIANSFTKRY